MSDAIVNLQIGDVLQLQYAPPSERPDRFAVKLIGYLPGQSLVITTPTRNGKPILVREGQKFTVRLLQGSNIFGFLASVLFVSSRPFPNLHLTYPEEVECAEVRNAPRVNTAERAILHQLQPEKGQREDIPVIIQDISSTGARIILHELAGKVGDKVQILVKLHVCGGEDRLELMGIIRNIRESIKQKGRIDYVLGLEFIGVSRFQQLLICGFVLGHIAKEIG